MSEEEPLPPLPKAHHTLTIWNRYDNDKKFIFIDTVVEYCNFSDETRIDPQVILDLVEERFPWGQYKDDVLSRVVSGCIESQKTISD